MGKVLRDTTVKVGGQSGPIGKGQPLTQVLGPGGTRDMFLGPKQPQNPQVPGFKSLMQRLKATQRNNPMRAFYKRITGKTKPGMRFTPSPRMPVGPMQPKPQNAPKAPPGQTTL